MAGQSKTSTDHNTIKKWAEEHDGKPARVKGTGNEEGGLLRINFPGYAEDNLEEISWEEFFKTFEDRNLAMLYQEETKDGKESRFSKFVNRES
ncbi:hypothetical protein [Adhaeribacter aquaticus]|uniref:hypothetical protein n=1 Tax=Adhaeribacter aquaticus TaxID=299567 RepID=UPI0003F85E45|nr:hypothetical protein [Adhaeribacter aquaticus]